VLSAEKTGLSVAVTRGDKWSLDLETISGGYVSDPLALIMIVDDGIADIPVGGTTEQVLSKASGTDYDIEWATPASAGATDLDDLTDVDLTTPATDGQTLIYDGDNSVFKAGTPSGSGDVVGPSSATDDAIALFDGTTGKLIQD